MGFGVWVLGGLRLIGAQGSGFREVSYKGLGFRVDSGSFLFQLVLRFRGDSGSFHFEKVHGLSGYRVLGFRGLLTGCRIVEWLCGCNGILSFGSFGDLFRTWSVDLLCFRFRLVVVFGFTV